MTAESGNQTETTYLDRGADRIALLRFPAPEHDTGPIVVIWPALGTPARYYRHLAERLRAAGLASVAVDLRGTGASTPEPSRSSRYGYAELAGDVAAVIAELKPEGRPLLLLGHSLGGQLCALHLALTQDSTVDGLVLVAVGLPYYRSYPREGLRVLLFSQWIAGVTALARVWPGWAFGGRQARRVMLDWAYTARHGRYPQLDGIDVEAALRAVTTPVLAISVDGDRFTPAPTLDHLCGKLSAAAVERVHVTTAEAGAPLDHFAWVRASGPIPDRIAAFAARIH